MEGYTKTPSFDNLPQAVADLHVKVNGLAEELLLWQKRGLGKTVPMAAGEENGAIHSSNRRKPDSKT